MAEFQVKYQALVFKPFKGEALEGVVTNVNKVRPPSTRTPEPHSPMPH